LGVSDIYPTNVRGFGQASSEGQHSLYGITLADVEEKLTHWLIPGLVPQGAPVVLVGDEGIGKGLWWTYVTALVTTQPEPIDVLIVVAEDDLERTVKPRLIAARADMSRVHALIVDPHYLTGVPLLPRHSSMVTEAIDAYGAKLVIIDPWLSTVEGGMQVKDPQQARQVLDPVTRLARRTDASFILIAHTNRSGGSLRERYGSTAVLRQVARVAIVAAEDPEDETVLYVGVDKSNIASRSSASKFRKQGEGARWWIDPIELDVGVSIRDLVSAFDVPQDRRTSDKWPELLEVAIANGGGITRTEVRRIYAKGASSDAEVKRAHETADRQIRRWVTGSPKRLEQDSVPDTYTLHLNTEGDTE